MSGPIFRPKRFLQLSHMEKRRDADVDDLLARADAMTINLDDETIGYALRRGLASPFDGEVTLHCKCPAPPRAWPYETPRHWRSAKLFSKRDDARLQRQMLGWLPQFPPDWPERGILS